MVIVQGLLLRRLAAVLGERKLILIGTALMSVGLMTQGLTTGVATLGFAILLISVGSGLNSPSLSSLISREAGPSQQGVVLGVTQSAGALARIVGPPFGLGLFMREPSLPYFAASGIMAVACVAAAIVVRERIGDGTQGPETKAAVG